MGIKNRIIFLLFISFSLFAQTNKTIRENDLRTKIDYDNWLGLVDGKLNYDGVISADSLFGTVYTIDTVYGGIADGSITASQLSKNVQLEVKFLTNIQSATIKVFNLTATIGGTGTYSIDIPTSLYFIYGGVVNLVSNSGNTLTTANGNAHLLILNKSTRILSLLDYTSFNSTFNYSDYILAGYVFGSNGIMLIDGDYKVNNLFPYFRTSDMNSKKFITSDAYKRQIIDAYGNLKYTGIANAGGSGAKNETESVYEITANGTGYSGLRFTSTVTLESGVDYYVFLEVKRISGDASGTKEWRIGYPVGAGNYASFTPTDSWQYITGTFNTTSISYGLFISASNDLTQQVIQVRNVFVEKRTYLQEDHETRLNNLEASTSNWNTDLATSLSLYDNVFVPVGTHTITTPVTITTGKKISGVKGKSILQTSGIDTLLNIDNASDITITDLTLLGEASDNSYTWQGVSSGVIDSLQGAENYDNIGTSIGIKIDNSNGIILQNLEVKNFDRAGIEISNTGDTYADGFWITDCLIEHCYIGLYLNNEAEFSLVKGLVSRINQIAVYHTSGNMAFANCSFNTNRIGLFIKDGVNGSHSSYSNSNFNHCSLYGVCADSVVNGMMIDNPQLWYAPVYLKDSRGITVSDGLIGNASFYFEGSYSGGANLVNDMMFYNGTVYENYNSSTSNTKLKNNWFRDGSTSTSINN